MKLNLKFVLTNLVLYPKYITSQGIFHFNELFLVNFPFKFLSRLSYILECN